MWQRCLEGYSCNRCLCDKISIALAAYILCSNCYGQYRGSGYFCSTIELDSGGSHSEELHRTDLVAAKAATPRPTAPTAALRPSAPDDESLPGNESMQHTQQTCFESFLCPCNLLLAMSNSDNSLLHIILRYDESVWCWCCCKVIYLLTDFALLCSCYLHLFPLCCSEK